MPDRCRSYYVTLDGSLCGYVIDSDGEWVALRMRDGVSWVNRSNLTRIPMATAVNRW